VERESAANFTVKWDGKRLCVQAPHNVSTFLKTCEIRVLAKHLTSWLQEKEDLFPDFLQTRKTGYDGKYSSRSASDFKCSYFH
jgi:hypothetical protein